MQADVFKRLISRQGVKIAVALFMLVASLAATAFAAEWFGPKSPQDIFIRQDTIISEQQTVKRLMAVGAKVTVGGGSVSSIIPSASFKRPSIASHFTASGFNFKALKAPSKRFTCSFVSAKCVFSASINFF